MRRKLALWMYGKATELEPAILLAMEATVAARVELAVAAIMHEHACAQALVEHQQRVSRLAQNN